MKSLLLCLLVLVSSAACSDYPEQQFPYVYLDAKAQCAQYGGVWTARAQGLLDNKVVYQAMCKDGTTITRTVSSEQEE